MYRPLTNKVCRYHGCFSDRTGQYLCQEHQSLFTRQFVPNDKSTHWEAFNTPSYKYFCMEKNCMNNRVPGTYLCSRHDEMQILKMEEELARKSMNRDPSVDWV